MPFSVNFSGHNVVTLEYVGNGSRKYYRANRTHPFTAGWGRIGYADQGVKVFFTLRELDRKLEDKVAKGYVWITDDLRKPIAKGSLVRFRCAGETSTGMWIGSSAVAAREILPLDLAGMTGVVGECVMKDSCGPQWTLYDVLVGGRGCYPVARAYLEVIS